MWKINKSQQAHENVKRCLKVYLMTVGGNRLTLPTDYRYLCFACLFLVAACTVKRMVSIGLSLTGE